MGAEILAAVSLLALTEPVDLTLLPKRERHPRGDRLALRLKSRLRAPPGRSMTVWYSGSLDGPPPTSMYSCRCTAWPRALLRASSRVSNLVGVEIARDFGLFDSLRVDVAAKIIFNKAYYYEYDSKVYFYNFLNVFLTLL
jgi:hypothetical protein